MEESNGWEEKVGEIIGYIFFFGVLLLILLVSLKLTLADDLPNPEPGFLVVNTVPSLVANTGTPLLLLFRYHFYSANLTPFNASLLLTSEFINDQLGFDSCPIQKNFSIVLEPKKDFVSTTKVVFYEPKVYTLHYSFWWFNGSNYAGSIVIDVHGNTLNMSDMVGNWSDCLNDTFVPHRRERYGFNKSLNIPLERLKNHTILLNNSIKPVVVVVNSSSKGGFLDVNTSFNGSNHSVDNVSSGFLLDFNRDVPKSFYTPGIFSDFGYLWFGGFIIFLLLVFIGFKVTREQER